MGWGASAKSVGAVPCSWRRPGNCRAVTALAEPDAARPIRADAGAPQAVPRRAARPGGVGYDSPLIPAEPIEAAAIVLAAVCVEEPEFSSVSDVRLSAWTTNS